MKPLDIYETDFGFQGSGEGVIYKYDKPNHKYGDPQVYYFVLTINRMTQKQYLLFYSKYMNMQSIRRNVEVREDFSKYFRRQLFRGVFGNKPSLESFKKAIRIIKEL